MAPKEIPLKRNNRNNPQIKSYTDAIKRGQKNIHVVSRDGEWQVKRIGRDSHSGTFTTQKAAVTEAIKIAKNNNSELFIHGKNGYIKERRSYEADPRP